MKTTIWAAAIGILGAGAAWAQDKGGGDDLRREFEKRMQGLEEKFRLERERLEKEFREKREKFMPRKEEGGPRPRLEELVEKLLHRVESLERRLDERFGEFGKRLPRDFDFKDFRELMPRFKEFMPRFEDRDFRFEFRRKGDDREEERKPAPKKKAEKGHEDPEKPAPKKKVEKDHDDEEKPAPKKKPEKKEQGF